MGARLGGPSSAASATPDGRAALAAWARRDPAVVGGVAILRLAEDDDGSAAGAAYGVACRLAGALDIVEGVCAEPPPADTGEASLEADRAAACMRVVMREVRRLQPSLRAYGCERFRGALARRLASAHRAARLYIARVEVRERSEGLHAAAARQRAQLLQVLARA